MKGYLTNLEVAEEFYKRCLEREAITTEERLKVMNELIHEKDIKILKENQIKAAIKGKRVLRIRK